MRIGLLGNANQACSAFSMHKRKTIQVGDIRIAICYLNQSLETY